MSPDPDRFEGTEASYAAYRPGYSDATFQYVRERFELDEANRVLDLGCGAGQLAIPIARFVGEVVGMDPNERMLAEARQRAADAGLENAQWIAGSDADLDETLGTFDLATMGRSFHWMDQQRTLERLFSLTVPGGGIAIFDDVEWLAHGERDWQAAVYEVADGYVDGLPERVPASGVEYEEPWDELIARFGFVDLEIRVFESERTWSVEEILGYVSSLSLCSPAVLEDDREAFEADVRERLGGFGREAFVQDVRERIIAGSRPAGGGSG